MARCPGLAELVGLELRHNGLTDEGVTALTASPYLGGLRRLDLASNEIGR